MAVSTKLAECKISLRRQPWGHSWGTLRTLAQDRLKWREFVAALVVSDKKGSK